VAYMSPEQARSSEVDHRTDIWSLGVMLYEMLAGRRPFRSDYEQALIYSILNEESPPLSSFRKDLPEHLVALCARCLAKDSESRPQSMGEVVALLSAGSGRGTRRGRGGIARMKRRKVAAIAGGAFVVIVAASLFFTLRSKSPTVLPGNAVLGILQFENQTGDTATVAWPTFIQWRLFDNFAGRRHLAVYYPVTSNDIAERVMARAAMTREDVLREVFASTPITLIVDGILRKSVQGFRLDLRLAGMDRGTLYSASGDVPDGRRLANAVDTLSRQLAVLLPQGDQPEAVEGGAEQWRAPKIHLIPAVHAYDLGAVGGQHADTESIVYLENAIQIDWAYIAPRALLICRLMARGSADLAREHLQVLMRLRNLASPYEQLLIDWARATVEQDTEEQIRAVELLLEYSPGERILLYVLARLKYLQLDFHGCVETLQPAVETGWRYSSMYYLLGGSYEQLGKLATARRILEQGLSFEPVYPEIYSLLSALCRRDGDSLAGARYETAYLRATRERAPSPGGSYASLARLCLDRGQDEEASRLFGLAVREVPDSPRFHEGWGEALLYLGDTLAALGQYRRTLALNPRSPGALYRLGAIFEHQGKKRESLRYTELYLRTDSTGKHATEARARLKRQKE